MTGAYQVGELIEGQYRVERVMRGGMSIVYAVVDSVTGKRFALKGLAGKAVECRPELESRFEREATAWVNLDYHSHIVQAFAYLKRPEQPFLLLEYVDGPSLTDVLKSVGKLVPRQAIRWARQLCSGMDYAHKRPFAEGQTGLIHRDIKPSNIMITRRCMLKITDFGLAKLNDDRQISDTGRFMGTLAYSSPEQLRSAKHVDRRADVFSFGVVLYQMLVGRNPFDADSPAEMMQAVQYRRAEMEPVPELMRTAVQRCLEKSPARRFQEFAELDRALENAEKHCPLSDGGASCQQCGFVGRVETCPVCSPSGTPPVDWRGLLSTTETESCAAHPEEELSTRCLCGAPLPPDSRDCPKCGTRSDHIECSTCGHGQASTNNFCNQCGSEMRSRNQRRAQREE